MKIPVKIKLNDQRDRYSIDGYLVGFAPAKGGTSCQDLTLAGEGNILGLHPATQDAIVILANFDRCKLIQVPMRWVRASEDFFS